MEIKFRLGKFCIEIIVSCINAEKHTHDDKNADISEEHEETNQLSFLDEDSSLNEEYVVDDIDAMAKQFEEELKVEGKIYNIPNASDIPPRYGVSHDVEIITDKFEKEVEDIYEGRR